MKQTKNIQRVNAMQHVMNKNEIVYGIRKLNVIERLNIITDIWDEIKDSKELETVSENDKRVLLNRLATYRANPDSASDWEELRQEIHDRYAEKS
jgi:putative addiction module component (TIGR02574 family)